MGLPWTISELHPLLVHFPIALFSSGLLFDILGVTFDNRELKNTGFWMMALGLVALLFTICSGLLAFIELGSIKDLSQFTHGLTELIASFLFIILFWMRIQYQMEFRFSELKRKLYFTLHILAVGLMFYGAHLGAKSSGRI